MKLIRGIRLAKVTVGIATLVLFQSRAQAQDEAKPPAAPADAPKPTAEAAAVDARKHTNVYKSQFDKVLEVGRWSPTRTDKAPNGRSFLGEYGYNNTLDFTLGDLPAHRYVRVRMDLFILKSWDGVGRSPTDTWGVMDANGPLLLITSFCNPQSWKAAEKEKKDPAPVKQNYPDEYKFASHKAGTGSSGEGEKLKFQFREDLNTTDSIYKIDLTFPHTDKDLALRFFSRLSNQTPDESWALDNVIIDTIDSELPLDEKQLAALWKEISGKDPVAANTALWKVVAAGPKALASIEQHWNRSQGRGDIANPKLAALRAKVEKLVVGLTAEDFVDRQLAQKELTKLGDESLEILEALFNKSKDPELRRALNIVITKIRKARAAKKADSHQAIVNSRIAHIRRIFTAGENDFEITSSPTKKPKNAHDSIGAVADGYTPESSKAGGVPRWTWFPNRGTKEWLQYEFKKPKTISMAEVYWFRADGGPNCSLPESWRLLYQTPAGEWKPVQHKGDYKIETDQMNQLKFKPVLTGAVRLEVQLKEGRSGGVHEFRITHPKPAK